MNATFKGFLLGIASVTMISLGAAFAFEETPKLQQDLIAQINRLVTSQCHVNVGQGRISASSRCLGRDQVMTGIDSGGNGYIYCAEVTVECFHETSSAE